MPYFGEDFEKFLIELEGNNNREWFAENRRRYENNVKEPFKNFVESIYPLVKSLDPEIVENPKDSVYRINRDTRFNPQLLPYFTYMRAFFAKGGRRSPFAGFFLKVGADFMTLGGGAYYLEKENLKKVRIEIAFNEAEFDELINDTMFRSVYGKIQGEKSQHIPKEFREAYEKQPIVGNKQFFYHKKYNKEELPTADKISSFILQHYQTGLAINQFLKRALEKTNQMVFMRMY
jgi:uncharacterized protein (TIGR02453 family)